MAERQHRQRACRRTSLCGSRLEGSEPMALDDRDVLASPSYEASMLLATPNASLVHVPLENVGDVHAAMSLQKVSTNQIRGGPAPFRMSRFAIKPGGSSPLDTHVERE